MERENVMDNKSDIINNETYEKVKKYMESIGVKLDERALIANSNFFNIVSEKINNKLSINELFENYDFIIDVIQGKFPKIINHVNREDRIKTAIRLLNSDDCPKAKDLLTDEEKKFLAFCIIYSFFTYTMNEENEEMEQSIYEFNSTQNIVEEYNYYKRQFPERFNIYKISDYTKDNYGLVVENPIEVTSVGLEYQYLNSIETADNRHIIYDRIGSFSRGDNIIVDGYAIYVNGIIKKKKITTLYITSYGTENSMHVPKGFKFIN